MEKIELDNPLIIPKVQVAKSTLEGLGVFATKDFRADELIEESPVLVLDLPAHPALSDYVFKWDDLYISLPLGFAALMNHSDNSNVKYELDKAKKRLNFFAAKDIKAGEELFVSYGDAWFETRNMAAKKPSQTDSFTREAIFSILAILFVILLYVFIV